MTSTRRKSRPWFEEEDLAMVELVSKHGLQSWVQISRDMCADGWDRSAEQCRARWVTAGFRVSGWQYLPALALYAPWTPEGIAKFNERWIRGAYK